jgi:cytochrome c5
MRNNRLLIIAFILIALGLIGIFATTWSGSYHEPRRMFPMPGMMTDGMMGRGMMNRDQMKDMMQRMMPGMLPPGVKPESLPEPDSRGANLLVRYCSQCHDLPSPAMHTAEEWPQVADRMLTRMSMMSGMMSIENPSLEERQAIVAYLKANALKSISPNDLPAPESKGALIFKETCSQCHALPDPKLHTSGEWPKVLERMTSNMQSMGRRVITEDEKKAILSYLIAYAPK